MINELKVTLAAKGVVKVVGCGGCGKGGDGTGLRPGEATGRVEVTTPGSPREGDEQGRRSRTWRLIFCAPPPPFNGG